MTVNSAELKPAPLSGTVHAGHGAHRPEVVAALIAAGGAAAILIGVAVFQYGLNIAPCPLCLDQRIPYYVALPLALAVAGVAAKGAPRLLVAVGFSALVLAFLTTAGIGAYHAGVEWKLWPGPADCTGEIAAFGAAGSSLIKQMQTTSIVRCDEVQWRFVGLSLAGYNVLIALALAALAGWGLRRTLAAPASTSLRPTPSSVAR